MFVQWTSKLRRPAAGTVLGGLALVVAVTGGGYAVAQSQPQIVFACQSNKMLFLADPATTECPAGQQRVELTTTSYSGFAGAAEHEALTERVAVLEAKLSKVSYDETGLNDLPTLKIDGANLQIVSGSGATDGTANGLGNLFIGYNERRYDPHEQLSNQPQTGSHNLVIGSAHFFTSYGGLLVGRGNTIMGPWSFVGGGHANTASGLFSAVSGGSGNTASGFHSSVSGGIANTASGRGSSVSGGQANKALGDWSSILGGQAVTASADYGTSP